MLSYYQCENGVASTAENVKVCGAHMPMLYLVKVTTGIKDEFVQLSHLINCKFFQKKKKEKRKIYLLQQQ